MEGFQLLQISCHEEKTFKSENKNNIPDKITDFSEFERIYVFSRDGDIIELPKGSTVLDFAYYVHTQVGNRAQAARVNQRYVPLTYQLKIPLLLLHP